MEDVENGGNGVLLSADNISKVKAKLESNVAQEVNYTPKATASTVTIPSANNDDFDAIDSNEGVDNQVFSQASLNATGTNAVKWYLLNVDETGVTLVSEPTNSSNKITFRGYNGYANCLYYLDQITSTLFSNSDKGIIAHCLRLTDIRETAKKVNNWSNSDWETNFVNQAPEKYLDQAVETNEYYRGYPSLYGTTTDEPVIINNPMYDENSGGDEIPMSICAKVETVSLNINGTYFNYVNYSDEDVGLQNQLNKLGEFGETGIAKELFNSSSENIFLASRCVYATTYMAGYGIRMIKYGCIDRDSFATGIHEMDWRYTASNSIRAVVKVPAAYVNVDAEGNVSIKN